MDGVPLEETFARGYEAAKIAVEIGNDDPVALTLGGFGIAYFGRDRPEQGLTYIERALTLNPNYPGMASCWHGVLDDRQARKVHSIL